jgi:arabinogalactan endo-1,4-beta-galactosidase
MIKFSFFLFAVFFSLVSKGISQEIRNEVQALEYRGGDISMLLKYKELNQLFKSTHQSGNVLDVMKSKGCNFFRVRLFVNPNKQKSVIQDLDYVIKIAKILKKSKVKFLLDIHYSDTWADPGQQTIPAQWRHLSFDKLVKKVRGYTVKVMTRLKEENCFPHMVQVGNEITHGMLWPHGKIHAKEGGWKNFTELLKAGISGVRTVSEEIKVMVHMAPANTVKGTRHFFDSLKEYGVEYDLIGLSYYPWWHGNMDNLKEHIHASSVAQKKPFIIVECAYVYSQKDFGKSKFKQWKWGFTPEGQKQFVVELIDLIRETSLGVGIVWWYPESVKVKGLNSWNGGKSALFDIEGKALPALDSLGDY